MVCSRFKSCNQDAFVTQTIHAIEFYPILFISLFFLYKYNNKGKRTMEKKYRYLTITALWYIVFSIIIVGFILLQGNFFSIMNFPIYLLSGISLVNFFVWQYRKFNNHFKESTNRSLYNKNDISSPWVVPISVLLFNYLDVKTYLIFLNSALFLILPGFIGSIMAVLFWERRKRLHIFQNGIGAMSIVYLKPSPPNPI